MRDEKIKVLAFSDSEIFKGHDFSYKIVSEMTYTVSSGTLNSSIPYHFLIKCVFIPKF